MKFEILAEMGFYSAIHYETIHLLESIKQFPLNSGFCCIEVPYNGMRFRMRQLPIHVLELDISHNLG